MKGRASRPRPLGHLAPSDLLDLAGAAAGDTRGHLADCPRCSDLLAEVAALVEALRAPRAPLPGAELLRRVEAAYCRPRPAPAAVAEVRARLRPEQAPAGVRSGAHRPSRLVFAGAGLVVTLGVSPQRRGLRILGQASARAKAARLPLLAWAEQAGRVVAESPVAAHGLFLLEVLAAGPLYVLLDLEDCRLRLGPLPVESS